MHQTLRNYGLAKMGFWRKGGYATVKHLRDVCPFGIAYDVSKEWHDKKDVVYAFVINDCVRYVGETTSGMASRFNGYRYGNPLVTDTDNRIKIAITDALNAGHEVEIWACQPSARLSLPNGEELVIPASKPLEEHLIAILGPELNVKVLAKSQRAQV